MEEEDGAARGTRGGAPRTSLKTQDLQEQLWFKYWGKFCTPTWPQVCKNWEREARSSC